MRIKGKVLKRVNRLETVALKKRQECRAEEDEVLFRRDEDGSNQK